MLEVQLTTATDLVLATLTRRLEGGMVEWGLTGPASLRVAVRMPALAEQLRYYDRAGALRLVVRDGAAPIWRGRVEEIGVGDGELTLTAYGGWREAGDRPYTALWSDTRTEAWFPVTSVMVANRVPEAYDLTTDGQMVIAANKNAIQGNAPIIAGQLGYAIPSGSGRLIRNVSFDYAFTDTEGNYVGYLQSFTVGEPLTTAAWTFGANIWGPVVATGSGAVCVSLTTPTSGLGFLLFRAAANAANANETADNRLAITNLRVTTQPLAVDTTLTANAPAGATGFFVASGTNITVGQTLYLGGANPERVDVTAVAGLTIGCTPLAFAKVAGDTVRAQRVLASDIAQALVTAINSEVSSDLISGPAITATTRDYPDALYEDVTPADILKQLAVVEQRRVSVRDGALVFEPRDATARRWLVEASSVEVVRALDAVRNSAYPLYQDASGRALRGATQTDAASVARWGVTRRAPASVNTTDAGEASALTAITLGDTADPPPRVRVGVRRVRTGLGQRVALWRVQPGDIVTIPAINRSQATDVDQVAVLRVARVRYDLLADALEIEAETDPTTLDVLLAQPAPRVFDVPPLGQLIAWEKRR